MPRPALVLLALAVCRLNAQSEAVADAVASLEHGDFAAAEQTLRTELKTHPNDTAALDVLSVALDQDKKFAEADQVYKRALGLSPSSPGLLNNYGNHLVATGKSKEARPVFLKVLALNPAQANAGVQMARIELELHAPASSLTYLDRLPANARQNPEVTVLRMQALYALHRDAEANTLLTGLTASASNDPRLNFSLGAALASVREYGKAEDYFSRAAEASPGNFDALYELGLSASHAGHNQRAREALQAALAQQPQNVDVLYDLAAVLARLNRSDEALELLAQAVKLAPERADVQLLLAHTTADVGYFGDAVQAWNTYLKLFPNDDVARRERGFALTAQGQDSGVDDLRWFVRKHPNDAMGHYELGTAESAKAPEQAHAELDRALALKPDLLAAHVARGLLSYREANPAAALPDFEFAAKRDPSNAAVLDRLGQTYMSLERPGEAVPVLRQAAQLAPRDSRILLHFGRALSSAGQADEAKLVLARYTELGPDKSALPHPAGLVDFLGLSPEEQLTRYRAGVERTVQQHPDNAEAQARYLELLLQQGDNDKAARTAQTILTLKPSAVLLADVSGAFLNVQQYTAAAEFLKTAMPLAPTNAKLRLDEALTVLHTKGTDAALELVEQIPETGRTGDYYLARAGMLASAGQFEKSAADLKKAMPLNPSRPELFRQTAVVLLRDGRVPEAAQLLDAAARTSPDNPDILLLQAAAQDLAGNTTQSERNLKTIEARWPEWPNVRVAHALILESHQQYDKARDTIKSALTLGVPTAAADYSSAVIALHATPARLEDADQAVREALSLAPNNASVHALAGELALRKQDFNTAVEQYSEAVRLNPHLLEAHANLAKAYAALGRESESQRELNQLAALQQTPAHAQISAAQKLSILFQ